ncbi:CTP synthase [Acrasis kona]|uniref:CTP synthase n=1 Tax=Acrasis kona TaxID=1008807 RepID=A0AAW2Z4D3_9EUKA
MMLRTRPLVRNFLTLHSARTYSKFDPLIGEYNEFPIDLFRVNGTEKVILRDYDTQMKKNSRSYDLVFNENGLVDGIFSGLFERPNGASLRPNSRMMQEIVRNFKGKNVTVYEIPKGTKLPEGLTLKHEHSDHYSIQTTKPISLKELNAKLTEFMKQSAKKYTKNEWCDEYPFESAKF